jgi:hypothetical protein
VHEKTDNRRRSRSLARLSFVSRPQIMTVTNARAAEWEHLFYDSPEFRLRCRTFLCQCPSIMGS